MVVVFMVAEKPSLAASIANILSNKNCNTKKGFNGACNVHGKKRELHCQTWLDFFKIRVVKRIPKQALTNCNSLHIFQNGQDHLMEARQHLK